MFQRSIKDSCSSSLKSKSSGGGDPTVASLGVRHSSPMLIKSLRPQTFENKPVGSLTENNSMKTKCITPVSTVITGTTSSLSSGTGTTSPVSSTSPRLSTCSSSLVLAEPTTQSVADCIIRELIDTESAYVRDLEDIIIGYIVPLRIEKIIPESDIECIFSNIEEIYYLNKRMLMRMQKAADRSSGPSTLAIISRCFSDKFNCEKLVTCYRRYCSSFAASNARLDAFYSNNCFVKVKRHFRDLQVSLGHTLPLSTYLLKPVQRILKYQLLWQKLAQQFEMSSHEHSLALNAAVSMIHIAEIINNCVSPQHRSGGNNNESIQSSKNTTLRQKSTLTSNLQSSTSTLLSNSGSSKALLLPKRSASPAPCIPENVVANLLVRVILMQGQLVLRGAKNPRHVIIFDTSLVIYKIHRSWRKNPEQEQLIHQFTIPADNLTLSEVTDKNASSTSFSVEANGEPKSPFIFQAETAEKKRKWCDAIQNAMFKSKAEVPAAPAPKQRHLQSKRLSVASCSSVDLPPRSQHERHRSASPFVAPDGAAANSCSNPDIARLSGHPAVTYRNTVSSTLGSDIKRNEYRHLRPPSLGSIGVNETVRLSTHSTVNGQEKCMAPSWPGGHLDSVQAINRTDSEKWRERSRWRGKAASLDRRYIKANSDKGVEVGVLLSSNNQQPTLAPWKHVGYRQGFVRRSSFVSDTHLLHVSQQHDGDTVLLRHPVDDQRKLYTPNGIAGSQRSARSSGLRRFFDAVAKRFKSNDRTKSFRYSTENEGDMKENATLAMTQSVMPSTGYDSDSSPSPRTPVVSEVNQRGSVNNLSQRSICSQGGRDRAMSTYKQQSCSELLFTPRSSNQKFHGARKKHELAGRTKYAHWAASGVTRTRDVRDVFV